MAHTGESAEQEQGAARVASTVIRVSQLERSVALYCDVFACRVALREPEVVLLLTPDGFQIYLSCRGRSRRASTAAVGIQYLMWATDSTQPNWTGSRNDFTHTTLPPIPTSRTA